MNDKYITILLSTIAALLLVAAWVAASVPASTVALLIVLVSLWLGSRVRRNTLTLDVSGHRLRITEAGLFGLRPRTAEIPTTSVVGISVLRAGQQSTARAVFLSMADRNIGVCLERSNGRLLVLTRHANEHSAAFRRTLADLEEFLGFDVDA